MRKKLVIVAALVAALVLPATPAGATYILPDDLRDKRFPAWQWGKCRHHEAPWGAGRDRCGIVRSVRGAR